MQPKKVQPYVVAIPTYHRSNTIVHKSLKTLQEGGVPAGRIVLFVANREEEALYKAAIPNGRIVVGVPGIAKQRTFIREYFPVGQRVVSIDDDVEGLFRKKGPKGLLKIKDVDAFFKAAFGTLEKEGLYLWGVYPVRNPFFMKDGVSTGLKFIIGALHGYIVRHDKDIIPSVDSEGKEDYEQSILYYKKDGGVVRFNDVGIKTQFLAKGGLGPDRFAMNKAAANYLVLKYPDIVSVFHRKNGMTEVRLKRMDREGATSKATSKAKSKAKTVRKKPDRGNMPTATRKRRV
jgi:hypothetical protein